jgi:hypothetical protein
MGKYSGTGKNSAPSPQANSKWAEFVTVYTVRVNCNQTCPSGFEQCVSDWAMWKKSCGNASHHADTHTASQPAAYGITLSNLKP